MLKMRETQDVGCKYIFKYVILLDTQLEKGILSYRKTSLYSTHMLIKIYHIDFQQLTKNQENKNHLLKIF